MLAMRLHRPGLPLQADELPLPEISAEQVLLKVLACGVCRTDCEEFMNVAADLELHPAVEIFNLKDANEALQRLRAGRLNGAAVLHST
jgi:D-arabinose 1-dehydrogenase-like Zn-dependent alcohol dehydrogenase